MDQLAQPVSTQLAEWLSDLPNYMRHEATVSIENMFDKAMEDCPSLPREGDVIRQELLKAWLPHVVAFAYRELGCYGAARCLRDAIHQLDLRMAREQAAALPPTPEQLAARRDVRDSGVRWETR